MEHTFQELDDDDDNEVRRIIKKAELERKKLIEFHEMTMQYRLQYQLTLLTLDLVDPMHMGNLYTSDFGYWGMPEMVDLLKMEELRNRRMDSLIKMTAQTISPLFEHFEQLSEFHRKEDGINRCKLILVGDQTVEEIMKSEHLEKAMEDDDVQDFSSYFAENYEKETNRIVAEGIAANKHIEVFLPDKDGTIFNSVEIKQDGIELGDFMNPLHQPSSDVIAKKREQIEKSLQKIQKDKVHFAVERINKADKEYADAVLEYVEQDQIKPLKELPLRLNYKHGGIQAICMAKLMADGYPIHDICNPKALKEEKQAIGTEFIQHARTKDEEWFRKIISQGQKAVLQALDNRMTTQSRLENLPELESVIKLSRLGYDLGRESHHISSVFDTHATENITTYMQMKVKELKSIDTLLDTSRLSLYQKDISQIAASQMISKAMKQNESKSLSQGVLSSFNVTQFQMQVAENPLAKQINHLCNQDAGVLEQIKKKVIEGTLIDSINVRLAKDRQGNLAQIKMELSDNNLKETIKKAELQMQKVKSMERKDRKGR